jgi:predicted ATPase
LGETPQLFPVIYGLYAYYVVRAELHEARQLAEQLLRLAESVQDPALVMGAHYVLGTSLQLLGEPVAGHEQFERAIALHNPQQHRAYRALYRRDPGLYCRSQSVRTLWLLGYPEQAERRLQEVLALARQIADPQSLAFVLAFPAYLHQLRREAPQAQERAEACIAHCQEHGIAQERVWVSIVRGWALAEQGRLVEGIAQMRENLAALRAMQAEVFFPYFLGLLAETLGRAGQVEEGLEAVAEALGVAHRTGERYYEADLYRIKGELTLKQASSSDSWRTAVCSTLPLAEIEAAMLEEAEGCFQQAIEIARRQGAKSLELRAVMSLSRLWQQQGRGSAARRVLAEIYSWFAEGGSTPELKEAQALLAAL